MTCLRTGYRSVCLKNRYSEDLELASLLIHISIGSPHHRNGDSGLTNSHGHFSIKNSG